MNLSFDSISDLEEFLRWADLYRAPGAPEPDAAPRNDLVADGMAEASDPLPTIDTSGVAFDTPQQPLQGQHASLGDKPSTDGAAAGSTPVQPEQTAEPTRRKRRTKAEIEADEKAAAAARDAVAQTSAAGAGEKAAGPAVQPEGANPFAQTAAPAGGPETAPVEQVPATGSDPVASDAATGEDGETVVTPFQHLTRAREFIAKHGMPKYNETFAKAGVDVNVMGYSAYQRSLHMAAMDELDKA